MRTKPWTVGPRARGGKRRKARRKGKHDRFSPNWKVSHRKAKGKRFAKSLHPEEKKPDPPEGKQF